MTTPPSPRIQRLFVAIGFAAIYFICYPQDLAVVLNPVEKLLGLSGVVSPWLYGLLAVALLCGTAFRIWGSKSRDVVERP